MSGISSFSEQDPAAAAAATAAPPKSPRSPRSPRHTTRSDEATAPSLFLDMMPWSPANTARDDGISTYDILDVQFAQYFHALVSTDPPSNNTSGVSSSASTYLEPKNYQDGGPQGGEVTVYEIDIKLGRRKWTVDRRYRDCHTLYQDMKADDESTVEWGVITFPGKSFLSLNDADLTARMDGLQLFFAEVLERHEQWGRATEVLVDEFLEIPRSRGHEGKRSRSSRSRSSNSNIDSNSNSNSTPRRSTAELL